MPACSHAGGLVVSFQLPCCKSQSQGSPSGQEILSQTWLLLLLAILASDSSLSCSLCSPSLWPCEHAGAQCSCSIIHSPLIPKSQRESVPSFPDLFFSSAGADLIITGLLFCTSKIAQKMLQKTKLYCIETENNFRIEWITLSSTPS